MMVEHQASKTHECQCGHGVADNDRELDSSIGIKKTIVHLPKINLSHSEKELMHERYNEICKRLGAAKQENVSKRDSESHEATRETRRADDEGAKNSAANLAIALESISATPNPHLAPSLLTDPPSFTHGGTDYDAENTSTDRAASVFGWWCRRSRCSCLVVVERLHRGSRSKRIVVECDRHVGAIERALVGLHDHGRSGS